MSYETVLKELKTGLNPYLPFWEDWTLDEACFLEKTEIETVAFYVKNNFTYPLTNGTNDQPSLEKHIIWKLKFNRSTFTSWVIFKFLCILIQMAKLYGYDEFFDSAIKELKLPEEIKLRLVSFKTHTVRQLFEAYTEEDFKRSWVYENILAFHAVHIRQKGL